MSTAIAKNLMAEMKLLGMFAAYDQAVTDATRDQSGYSEFLDTLLQAETDYRQERKTGYRIKAAKFTLRPAFETSTSPPVARSAKPRSRSFIACSG
jgi:IstB-like ATP binding protein